MKTFWRKIKNFLVKNVENLVESQHGSVSWSIFRSGLHFSHLKVDIRLQTQLFRMFLLNFHVETQGEFFQKQQKNWEKLNFGTSNVKNRILRKIWPLKSDSGTLRHVFGKNKIIFLNFSWFPFQNFLWKSDKKVEIFFFALSHVRYSETHLLTNFEL